MEQSASWWHLLVTLLGTLGGFEFVKWLFNRKRIERTDEFKIIRETNEFLQEQLQDKEQRFAEQTQLVRKQNTEILALTTTMAEKDIEHTKIIADLRIELSNVRCEDGECPFRRPPNAQTPPKPGLTKEEYHQNKTKENENID